MTEQELLDFIHQLNGERVHDQALGKKYGLTRFATDIIRSLMGKVSEHYVRNSREKIESVIKDYLAGMAITEIGKKYDMAAGSVFDTLKRNGIEVNRHSDFWTPIKCKKLVYLREVQKKTFPQIASELGKSSFCCQWKYRDIKKKALEKVA